MVNYDLTVRDSDNTVIQVIKPEFILKSKLQSFEMY
jgi:hypothetical protein